MKLKLTSISWMSNVIYFAVLIICFYLLKMDDILSEFRDLQISALRKSKEINRFVREVTIGPGSIPVSVTQKSDSSLKQKYEVSKEKNETNSPVHIFDRNSPLKKVIYNLEQQRLESVEEAVNKRRQKFLDFNKQQLALQKSEWNKQQQIMVDHMQQQELQILHALKQHELDSLKKNEKLIQYYQELAERKQRNDKEIQAKEERHKHIALLFDKVANAQKEFKQIYIEILQILKDCSEEEKVKLTEYIRDLKLLSPQIDAVVNKGSEIYEEDANKCINLLTAAKHLRDRIRQSVLEQNQHKMLLLQQKQKQEEEQKKREEKAKADASNASNTININSFVSKRAFKIYTELQLFIKNFETSYKDLLSDPSFKTFKFDCKKAVNIPVNAISAVSSKHLIDKYLKLHNLLSGKVVEIGETKIVVSQHPQGIKFSTDLLAKKFVLQGDLMISSNHDAAFCYASIIISLWNEFPEFGKLFLGYLYEQCPYIVPIYLPRIVDQTDEEYYKSLGYKYSEGVVEKQDKFLKRMNGFMRLYCAILISKPKNGQNSHPHDLSNGWLWLTSILNMEPRLDISAMILRIFLEVTGSTMLSIYKKQFRKIVDFIGNDYMGKLKKIDTGGPVTRLEVLLDDYKKSGIFAAPSGLLPNHFF